MAEPRDLTRDLELHRQVLEETVTKLTNSLHHWQQWYIEYASLQEEVTTLPIQPPTRKDLARIKRDFESEIITKQEVNEIFGKNDLKPAEQILSVLDRRLDYVERNVDTLRKQLEAAENKLAASRVLADPDGAVDEESGLPITDIIEEIDEEGNVISHRLQTPGDVSGKVLEALKKAGVDGFGDEEGKEGDKKPVSNGESKGKEVIAPPTQTEETKKTTASVSAPTKHKPNGKRKSVSFAEDTKAEEADEEDEEDEKERLRAIKKLEHIMETAKVEQDEFEPEAAVIPEDESEDDAQLRREMLEYSTQEIGPIVAELELDEGVADDDDYDFEYTDEEDEDEEDDLGRSKYSVITDDYVKRMQELEKRLGVESAFATERAAPKPEVPVEGLGRITIQPESSRPPKVITEVTEIDHSKPKTKKGVRFAEELDVAAEDTNTVTLPERPAAKKEPEINPISDVMERSSKPASRPVEAPTKKPSRFKKDRAAGIPTPAPLPATPLDAPVRFLDQERTVAPSGPEGKTVADAVLERNVSTEPKEPDELDATLLHQEAAVEYHRMRNRLIQKQGGFAKEEEEKAITTFDELEEEESGKKRMSRFKAARLSRQ